MITRTSYKYQKCKASFLVLGIAFFLLPLSPAQAAEGPGAQKNSNSQAQAQAQAKLQALEAQLAASRKEAAKYKEIARKNREVALELRQVAVKWQENAKKWQNATHLAQAEALEIRTKFREVNAKLQASRGSGGSSAGSSRQQPRQSTALTSTAADTRRSGIRQDGQAYGYTEIGTMTQDIARIREQRRSDANMAEQMLQDAMGGGSRPEEKGKPRR
jgi:cysteine synthase